MTLTDVLRDEVAATCSALESVARRLLVWAAMQEGEPCPLVSTELLRETARALAHQGGRLGMACELGLPGRRAKS